MRSRLLAILLSVAVVMAVGVCPCGRTLLLDRAGHMWNPTTTAMVPGTHGHCPACRGGDQQAPASDQHAPDASKCASAVSGELPAGASHAPVLYALPVIYQPRLLVDDLGPVVAHRDDHALRAGLPPPPTLLSLSCCLTT